MQMQILQLVSNANANTFLHVFANTLMYLQIFSQIFEKSFVHYTKYLPLVYAIR